MCRMAATFVWFLFLSFYSSPVLAAAPVQHHSGNISTNQTWIAGSVHVVDSDVRVLVGVTLTIQADAVVKFAGNRGTANAGLFVDGTLIAAGTTGLPIYFTSLRDDNAGPGNVPHDTNGDGSATVGAAGDWERLQFGSTSTGSTLTHCVIRYGGICCNPGSNPMVDVVGSSPSFDLCTFAASTSNGLSVAGGATPTISNSSITGCGTYPIVQSLDSDPVFTAVVVSGNQDGNGIGIPGGTISVNRRWRNMGLTFIVSADLRVGLGATLTVDPGVAVKFAGNRGTANAGLFVDGTLTAVGTAGLPIYFTSLRDDNVGPGNLPEDTNGNGSATVGAAGDWERLQFGSTSTGSTLTHCVIRYGGICCNPGSNPMVDVVGSLPSFDFCTIAASTSNGLSVTGGATPTISNSSITGCGTYPIVQSLDSDPTFAAVVVSGNQDGNGIGIPAGTISVNRRWRNMGLTFIVSGDLRVGLGTTLTVDPGVAVKFAGNRGSANAGLFVDGTLTAVGTAGLPIYFTSLRDDNAGPGNLPEDTNGNGSATVGAAGDWERLQFGSTSTGSTLTHCVIRYGGICCNPGSNPMVDVVGSSPNFDLCTITNGNSTLVECSSNGNPTILRSSILSSTAVFGVNNTSSGVTINATLNWWGAASGPLDPSPGPPLQNAGGQGSRVSDYVDYGNWQVGPPANNPTVVLSPESIVAVAYGSTSVQVQLQLQNSGNGTLSFSVTEAAGVEANDSRSPSDAVPYAIQDVSWLAVTPTGGNVGPSGTATLTVTLNPSSLASGQYSSYLIIGTNDPARPTVVVPVTFKVNPPLPPSSIVVGDPGTGASLQLSWGSSPSGGVARYRIYRGTSLDNGFAIGEVDASIRTYLDSYLEDNQQYYYGVSAVTGSGFEGARINGPARKAHYAVVLVHGVCSDSTVFGALKAQLRSAGFAVYADLSLTPNDARPQEVVGQLAARIAQIPGPKVNIVAHSMGGLVTREFIVRQKEVEKVTRVGTLITVATPHHGSDIANWVARRPAIRAIGSIFTCQADAPALWDLIPGSPFLNGLNYGAGPGEPYGVNTSEPRNPESLRDPAVRFSTLAGTGNMLCSALGVASRGAWRATDGSYMANDGAVSTFSAHLTNTEAQGWNDVDLSYGVLSHSGTCHPGLLASNQVGTGIMELLNELTPSQFEPMSPIVAMGTDEPTLTDLPSPAGVVAAGTTAEFMFAVPGTTLLQAYALGDPAVPVRLRTPASQLIGPSDTLSYPGLSYKTDPQGGHGYVVTEPDAGTWHLVIDASASGTPISFASVLQVASSRSVKVLTNPNNTESGDTIIVRASYENNGVPSPGATMVCTLTRPDASTTSINLFDDGVHGDSGPNDGYFGARVVPGAPTGVYVFSVVGTPPSGSSSTTRAGAGLLEVTPASDLAVLAGTVTVDQTVVNAGDDVTVFARVKNFGVARVNNILVQFSDGDPGLTFAQTSVDLNAGEDKLVQASWVAASPDTHVIRVTVDPFRLAYESNYANNTDARSIVLGQLVTA